MQCDAMSRPQKPATAERLNILKMIKLVVVGRLKMFNPSQGCNPLILAETPDPIGGYSN